MLRTRVTPPNCWLVLAAVGCLGVSSSVLSCTVQFPTNAHTPDSGPDLCGNGVLDPGESCDGTDFGGVTCESLGRPGGLLRCTDECTLDISNCGSPSRCVGTCTPCSSAADVLHCTGIKGCAWHQEACTGTCTPCVDLGRDECDTQLGCSQDAPACAGTCTPCTSLTTASECHKQLGCVWGQSSCLGLPTPCPARSAAECTDGCTLVEPGCTTNDGMRFQCQDATSEEACTQAGCSWNGSGCGDIFPDSGSCSSIQDAALCDGDTSNKCDWVATSSCTGSPDACIGRDQAHCGRGCSWHEGACSGQCTPCSIIGQREACSDQQGCAWQSTECGGVCTPCGGLDQQRCEHQAGCSWETEGACAGECTPCSAFTDKDSCTAQPGCNWVE